VQIYRIDRFKKQVDFQLVKEHQSSIRSRAQNAEHSARQPKLENSKSSKKSGTPALDTDLKRKPKFFEKLAAKSRKKSARG
jgi:hypothetical protein